MINKFLIPLSILIILSGCFSTSTPAKFFLLESSLQDKLSENTKLKNVRIGLLPVTIPGYLKQPQLVTQTDITEYNLDEFSRWAEPLNENIATELRSYIAEALQLDQVFTYPWSENPDIVLSLQIIRFHCQTDLMKCNLEASWNLNSKTGANLSIAKRSYYSKNLTTTDSKNITEEMSQLLNELSKEIVQSIK